MVAQLGRMKLVQYLSRDRVQALIALVLIVSVLTLVLQGKEIPEVLEWSLATVLGFYFGAQYANDSLKTVRTETNGGYT